jgi:hypothetical protein
MHPHHVRLTDGFALWKYCALRGTGFPIEELSRLRAPGLAAKTDEVLEAIAELSALRLATIRTIEAQNDVASLKEGRKLITQLKKGRIPDSLPPVLKDDRSLKALLAQGQVLEDRKAEYEQTYAAGMESILTKLREFAASERFREAVTWQNPQVLSRALNELAPNPSSRGTKNYHLVVSYLTRYCAKNDTIGFFGPTGWLTLDPAGESYCRPGASLVDERTVYFEYWCLDSIAEQASRIDEIRPHISVRRNPLMRLEGDAVVTSSGALVKLPAPLALLMGLCDGRLAKDAIEEAKEELQEFDEESLYEMLETLDEKGLVFWRIALPHGTESLEENLAEQLRAVPGEQAEELRGQLRDLVACRDRIAAAAGNPELLLREQQALASVFESVTGLESHRKGGQVYAGRGLCYEDTRRNIEVQLAKPFCDSIGPALDLVLSSARWFCAEVTQKYEDALMASFHELASQSDSRVELVTMMEAATAIANGSMVGEVRTELHRKWKAILELQDTEAPIQRKSTELVSLVQDAFATDRVGWPESRMQAPDVMVAARDFDEVARGEGLAVLGEVHVGRNTLFAPSHYWQSPHRSELIAGMREDLQIPLLDFVVPPALANRASIHSPIADHYEVEMGPTPSRRGHERRLSTSSLCVWLEGERLRVGKRDGGESFDILVLFQSYIRAAAVSEFSLLAKNGHVPRIQIDNLVISRAMWSVDPKAISFATIARGPEQFLAARAWARELRMPDRVFVKTAEEAKPVYVDLASPISVETVAKLLRKASKATFSEMLPTPEQCWLKDREGNRYTSELRLIAVDRLSPYPGTT